jgi:hypothetical protein
LGTKGIAWIKSTISNFSRDLRFLAKAFPNARDLAACYLLNIFVLQLIRKFTMTDQHKKLADNLVNELKNKSLVAKNIDEATNDEMNEVVHWLTEKKVINNLLHGYSKGINYYRYKGLEQLLVTEESGFEKINFVQNITGGTNTQVFGNDASVSFGSSKSREGKKKGKEGRFTAWLKIVLAIIPVLGAIVVAVIANQKNGDVVRQPTTITSPDSSSLNKEKKNISIPGPAEPIPDTAYYGVDKNFKVKIDTANKTLVIKLIKGAWKNPFIGILASERLDVKPYFLNTNNIDNTQDADIYILNDNNIYGVKFRELPLLNNHELHLKYIKLPTLVVVGDHENRYAAFKL